MEKKKGKGFLIIGIIASVISVILGIYLLQQGTNFIGHFTRFYGDFETYMSESMQSIGNILGKTAIIIKYGFSFLLISIGAIMFCFFGYKIASFDNEPNVTIKENENNKEASSKSLNKVADTLPIDNGVNNDTLFNISCPYCHQTIACKEEWRNSEIICPCCCNQFKLQ